MMLRTAPGVAGPRLTTLLALLLAAGCTGSTAPAPASTGSGSPPATTPSAPPSSAGTTASPVITTDGLGPYRAGAKAADLVRAGRLVRGTADEACAVWYEATKPYAPALLSVRVRDGGLRSVTVSTRAYATEDGARVGMTATDLRRIYGDRLRRLDGANQNYPDGWTVRDGGRSVAFLMDEHGRVQWIGAGLRTDAESIVTDVEHYPC